MARIDMTGGAAPAYARAKANEAAPWIVRLARLGYAAKGVVFIIVGVLAARLAMGSGGGTTDTRGALRVIDGTTFGDVALGLMGVGLLGYALWRFIGAATDAEDKGSEPKGIALRIGQVGSGIAYGALGIEALRLIGGNGDAARGDGAQHWTARVLAVPFGRFAIIAAGLGIVGYALWQIAVASREKKIRKRLALEEARPETARWVVRLGRAGTIARGIVFVLIGAFLVRAALRYDPNQAADIGDSLAAIAVQPFGRILLALIALGVVAYGVYQLATARWRRMKVS